jgi:hypothetical protein
MHGEYIVKFGYATCLYIYYLYIHRDAQRVLYTNQAAHRV